MRSPSQVAAALLLCTASCKTLPSADAQSAAATCQQDLGACVDSIVAAHGGLDAFHRWPFATYLMWDHWEPGSKELASPWPDGTQTILMHASRTGFTMAAKLEGTPHELGVDAKGGWGTGGAVGLPTVAARYGAGTSFVFALPFRLKDAGARVIVAQATIWQGMHTLALEVAFSSEQSRTPKDRWVIYVDPSTRQLLGCTFFASEYGLDVDVRMDRFVDVGGMRIPSHAVLELAATHLHFHSVDLVDVRLFANRPASLVDGPALADRSGEPWHPQP